MNATTRTVRRIHLKNAFIALPAFSVSFCLKIIHHIQN